MFVYLLACWLCGCANRKRRKLHQIQNNLEYITQSSENEGQVKV